MGFSEVLDIIAQLLSRHISLYPEFPIFFYSLTESKHLEIMEELKKRRESEEK